MNGNLAVNEVATTSVSALQALWSKDFNHLATTIIAVSRKRATPEITTALHTPPWLPQALDAAWHVQGNLTAAIERYRVTEDARLPKARTERMRVSRLRSALAHRHEALQRELNQQLDRTDATTAAQLAARVMMRLFPQEAEEIQHHVAHSYALPRENPWRPKGKDLPAAVESAIAAGMIPIEPGSAYHRLRNQPMDAFVRLVQKDARDQNRRLVELRDIRLYDRWGYALCQLLAHIAPQARANPHDGHLQRVDYLNMSSNEAEVTLRARRAFLAIWQRYQEHTALRGERHRLLERLRVQFSEQWVKIGLESREILFQRHPQVYEFVWAKVRAHTLDGENLQPRLVTDSEHRGQVAGGIRRLVRERFEL